LINGKKNGTWVYYFENGNVSRKINFKDDLEDGLVKTFFPDNKRNEEIFYSNGNVDSLYRFYRTGKIKERTFYSSKKGPQYISVRQLGQWLKLNTFLRMAAL
jgi:antitoxin component YwqK of YwqJK toxin-antitoxin module